LLFFEENTFAINASLELFEIKDFRGTRSVLLVGIGISM
jgi:hypothetical protein